MNGVGEGRTAVFGVERSIVEESLLESLSLFSSFSPPCISDDKTKRVRCKLRSVWPLGFPSDRTSSFG